MAKNKYEKLVAELESLISRINIFLKNVYGLLDLPRAIQFALDKGIDQDILEKKSLKKENEFLKILLYCPNDDELSNEIDWYEEEEEKNSFCYQLFTIHESLRRDEIIRNNLLKAPHIIYQKAFSKWSGGDFEHSDVPAKYSKQVIPFAPCENDSIALAYERVRKYQNSGKLRHLKGLANFYQDMLEQAIFEGIPSEDSIRVTFLAEWDQNLFGSTITKKGVKKGRWTNGYAIDKFIAARILQYFIKEFIENPQKKSKGEVACAMWIAIWVSKENSEHRVTLTKLLAVTTKDISTDEPAITIDGQSYEISCGLQTLLLCLRGVGKGLRARPLFENLSPRTIDRLFQEASQALGLANQVSPSAVLIPLLSLEGDRAPPVKPIKTRELIKPQAKAQRRELKQELKEILR